MNTRTTALLVGVAVIAALALTSVRRERTHDAAASARAAMVATTAATYGTSADAEAQRKPSGVVAGMPKSRMVVAYRLAPLTAFYDEGRRTGTFDEGIELVLG